MGCDTTDRITLQDTFEVTSYPQILQFGLNLFRLVLVFLKICGTSRIRFLEKFNRSMNISHLELLVLEKTLHRVCHSSLKLHLIEL